MKRVAVKLERTGVVVAAQVDIAASLSQRLQGLLGRAALATGEGMFLPACRSIHTCGMRFPIDVVFVDRHGAVVALCKSLPPWRMTPVAWRAWGALELPSGALQAHGVRLGDRLDLRESALTSF